MEEASDSDYVVIIDAGKIVAEGTPHGLKNEFASDFIKFYNHREEAEKCLQYLGIDIRIRGEKLSLEDYKKITEYII